MAVLAAQDWHLPSSSQAMDSPTTANQSPSRQQHTPSPNSVNHPSAMAQQSGQQLPLHLQQQPYPYPVQQQQASWSPTNAPYYPGFYQNTPSHPPYMHQGHQAQMSPNPFYDANNQFAQWAYQQMMFNAQQNHQMPMYPQHPPSSGSQRGRSGSNGAQQEFYPANNVFNQFPSGTPPPPHPSPSNNGYPRSPATDSSQPYGGFHPYRRPNRQQSQDTVPPQPHDWRSNPGGVTVFQPPYARNDASASSTSVNSSSSQSSRRRKDSQGSAVGGQNGSNPPQSSRSTQARTSNNTPGSSSSTNQRPHNRHPSASSTTSSVVTRSNGTSSSTSVTPNNSNPSSPSTTTPRPVKPSPLSQGNYTVAEKRVSRDDSDLHKTHDSVPGSRSGLKSRFRRALSFNALQEEETETTSKGKAPETRGETPVKSETTDSPDTTSSTLPKKTRKPLFNSKLNASTDNISLSSTMSSASMVIRKLGNIGKLTRRNSLAGITSLFKDKKDKEGEEGKSRKKGKKGAKAEASEASVSLATAELDRSEWSAELNGLTPAARLARQHTLKSNAEAAERAKAEAQKNTTVTPPAWEKNSSNRQGDLANGPVSEDGTRPADEDSDSDDDKFTGPNNNHVSQDSLDGWDDNEDWGEGEDDEDITIRGGIDSIDLDRGEDMEPWAIGLRRSIEKTRIPAKGILKPSMSVVEPPGPAFTVRARSNSYTSAPTHTTEIGPLARIPSSDPDHIDGLHHPHPHQPPPSSSTTPALPPLSFMSGPAATDSADSNPSPQAEKTIFSHSNSSAPVLSAVFSSNPPSLAHRSATAPVKRLTFASNLSVYDTFPSSVYDRRSEPATWSRLTPALAQRIKEELNSYKMEEMEVHAASRIHTQFFV